MSLVFALFPFYWMAITSLKSNQELYSRKVMPLIVHNPTLKHYVDLLTETNFLGVDLEHLRGGGALDGDLAHTSAPCSPIRWRACASPARRWSPSPSPRPISCRSRCLFVPLADLINRLGLGDTLTSVILTYPTLLIPFCAWLLMGYFRTVPLELEDAARIDGASRLQTLVKIVLPLCGPGFISAGIFAFTLAQNEFLYALIFLTKTEVRTVPVGAIAELVRGDVFYWGQLMAAALLGSIPVAIIYSFFVEHYVAGLTAGSVKG